MKSDMGRRDDLKSKAQQREKAPGSPPGPIYSQEKSRGLQTSLARKKGDNGKVTVPSGTKEKSFVTPEADRSRSGNP